MKVFILSVICSFILIDYTSCLSGYIDASVTQEKIRQLTAMLESGNTDFLEAASKIEGFSSFSTLVDNLTKDQSISEEKVKEKLGAELNKLSKNSPVIKEKKERLLEASQQYIELNREIDSIGMLDQMPEDLAEELEEEEGLTVDEEKISVEMKEVNGGLERKETKTKKQVVLERSTRRSRVLVTINGKKWIMPREEVHKLRARLGAKIRKRN